MVRFRTREFRSDQFFIDDESSSVHLDDLYSRVQLRAWKFIDSTRRKFPICNKSLRVNNIIRFMIFGKKDLPKHNANILGKKDFFIIHGKFRITPFHSLKNSCSVAFVFCQKYKKFYFAKHFFSAQKLQRSKRIHRACSNPFIFPRLAPFSLVDSCVKLAPFIFPRLSSKPYYKKNGVLDSRIFCKSLPHGCWEEAWRVVNTLKLRNEYQKPWDSCACINNSRNSSLGSGRADKTWRFRLNEIIAKQNLD